MKNYRLFLAFLRKDQRVFQPEDERNYGLAEQELVRSIQTLYDNVIVLENQRHWSQAADELERILQYLPTNEVYDDPKVDTVIVANVRTHLRYVSRFLSRKRR